MMSRSGQSKARRTSDRQGFTLIELILVLALLTIVASLAGPSLMQFFRGRELDSEARQLLSLTHAGQSRAVSAGFPMLLWVDSREHAYGLQEEGSTGATGQDADPKAESFPYSDALKIDVLEASLISVNGRSLPAIRFLPDGTADETSPKVFQITAADGATLWLIQATNRLSYEIRSSNR